MKKLSESELLGLLETRRVDLESELRRTEEAMNSLRGQTGNEPNKTKTEKREKIFSKALPIELNIPRKYDLNHTWDSKVLFVLTLKGAAFKEDVVEEICKLERNADPVKITNLVGVKLSTLLKQGHIQSMKEGRKFKYYASPIS